MEKIKLKCQVITPLFMMGADGRIPELRPSEFKGVIRWWWRAVKAEDDVERLRGEEAEIFGGAGLGQGKSKVFIKIISNDKLKKGENLKNDFGFDWKYDEKKRSIDGKHAGIGYLLYSTVLPRREKSYIKPGQYFYLEISSYLKREFEVALASLWLSIYLGGFGTRARRGGGNIVVTHVEGNHSEINFVCKASDVVELKDWMEENIRKIKRIIGQSPRGTTKYTVLKDSRILLFEPKRSWIEALNFLGIKFKDFRDKNRRDIFRTSAFGMPVMHAGFKVRVVPKNRERWASCIFFKVIKSDTQSGPLFFPVVVKLSPGGVKYVVEERKQGGRWQETGRKENFNVKLVDDFLNSLRKLPKKEELQI